jgi:hypothetical protein
MPAGKHALHTIDGHVFDFDNPLASTFTDHDIGHGLANICRFGGQATQFYSVAEHAIVVSVLVYHHYKVPQLAFAALHHDSAEAFTGDIPTPLKHKLGASYRAVYRDVEAAVAKHVGVPVDDLHAGVIKDADKLAMEIEAHVLKPEGWDADPALDQRMLARMAMRLIDCWDPTTAEAKFMVLHEGLATHEAPAEGYASPDYTAELPPQYEQMIDMVLEAREASEEDDDGPDEPAA